MCGKAIATRKVEEKNVGYLSLIPWRGLKASQLIFSVTIPLIHPIRVNNPNKKPKMLKVRSSTHLVVHDTVLD